ncbi:MULTISPECIES: hypothetical protein [Bacillus]|uniref:hypothetical protein n=1 Tax=Bacillus TaxID=1386 RepID=UPI0010625F4D|nr:MULTISPECIES: hypothetical protein [Bacillus]MCU5507478.1 hypothetical protein [Bacillus cereus]MDA2414869.1 hypothetical protein [Bacillus cereus]MDR4919931.1 hypothetical protein [Bacillus thuringiensis]MEC3157791.1 hypothetical protein [Bacillus thuringiensis]MED3581898.1 hypothetical protein [Bacillus thuringiensis]
MKRALFFFISIFFLGSCSIWYVTFSSESKSWTGQYKGHIKDDSEDGVFTFQYKGGDGNTEFKNLEIAINGAFSTMTQTSEVHKGARVEIKSSCESCAPLSTDEPIEVVIKWDDKYEEKMVLNLK